MDEGKLFLDIKFIIAQCNDADDIKNILIEGGAKHINYLSEYVTHVIADTNCPEAEEAIELFDKPVVSSLWVYLSQKAKKLLPTQAFSPIRNIFRNVVASFSSDLSAKDVDVLASTLTFYGARVSKVVTYSTHFIVATADPSDLVDKSAPNHQLKIVAPDWVLESVRLNRCCDEQLFDPNLLLPPPPPTPPPPPPKLILTPTKTSTSTAASTPSTALAPTTTPKLTPIMIPKPISTPRPTPRSRPPPPKPTLVPLPPPPPLIAVESIDYFGHDPKENVPENSPLIGCRFKIIDYEEINPKLMKKWCDAIKAAGGTFDENLENTTHLICENRLSDVYSKAIKLGIRCVTVYWIDDVLAKNRLSYPWKALHLPMPFSKDNKPLTDQMIAITNFKGKVRRQVIETIHKIGAKYTDYFSPSNSLIICGNVGGDKYERAVEWKVPIANCQILSDILLGCKKELKAMLTQSKYQLFNHSDPIKLDSYSEVRELMKPWTKPIAIDGKKDSVKPCLINGATKSSTNTPNSNGDSGIVTGESNNSVVANSIDDKIDVNKDNQVNDDRCRLEVNTISHECTSEEMLPLSTRSLRKSNEPIRLLFTNLDQSLTRQLESYSSKLGLNFANGPLSCTHLIMDRISRTPKFMCAFSHAKYILSYKWIVESHEANNLLDEKHFILQDKTGEERYSFNLVYSLLKRRKRAGLLFNNFVFFVTPSVMSSVSNIKEMIESAGGIVATRKLPSKMQVKQLKLEGKRFVVITCNEDIHLCSTLESYNIDIVNVEFVISGILRQDIDFEAHSLKTPTAPFIRPETTPLAQISQTSPPKKLRLEDPYC